MITFNGFKDTCLSCLSKVACVAIHGGETRKIDEIIETPTYGKPNIRQITLASFKSKPSLQM